MRALCRLWIRALARPRRRSPNASGIAQHSQQAQHSQSGARAGQKFATCDERPRVPDGGESHGNLVLDSVHKQKLIRQEQYLRVLLPGVERRIVFMGTGLFDELLGQFGFRLFGRREKTIW